MGTNIRGNTRIFSQLKFAQIGVQCQKKSHFCTTTTDKYKGKLSQIFPQLKFAQIGVQGPKKKQTSAQQPLTNIRGNSRKFFPSSNLHKLGCKAPKKSNFCTTTTDKYKAKYSHFFPAQICTNWGARHKKIKLMHHNH